LTTNPIFPFRSRSSLVRAKCETGGALIEFSLLVPWVVFLFIGAVDLGFYSHALIATQNAARVADLYTSGQSSTAADSLGACKYALDELKMLPSSTHFGTDCGASPLLVKAQSVANVDGQLASSVTVTYTTDVFVPIPGLLASQLTISRSVVMRVRT
jgi:hypothetical protein